MRDTKEQKKEEKKRRKEEKRAEDERWDDIPIDFSAPSAQKDEKLSGDTVTIDNPVVRKLDNFWYHHKWTVIISLFFAVVFVIGLVQILSKEKEDCMVLYGGPCYIDEENGSAIENLIASLLPGDLDGDGKRNVKLIAYEVYSEEEIRAINGTVDANGNRREINISYNQSQYESCNAVIGAGEVALCFLSPSQYDRLNGDIDQNGQVVGSRLVMLSELFDKQLPKGTVEGGDGVRLGDTDLYRFCTEMQVLPADTVICLLKPYVMGSTSKADYYDRAKTTFVSLVSFSAEE